MSAAGAVEFAAAICVDCYFWHHGVYEMGECPAENELGAAFMSLIESAEMWTYVGNMDQDQEPHFSWNTCDGCGSRLGGDRFDVEILQEPRK